MLDAHPSDRLALVTPEGELTYGALRDEASRLAAQLDVPAGARVLIEQPPGIDFVLALHACLQRGAVAVPLDFRLAPVERAARRAGAAARITADGILPGVGAPLIEPPGTALVVFTSGTTSAPKPVALTRANVQANTDAVASVFDLSGADRWLGPMPLTHVGGLMVLLRCAIRGATVELLPPPFDVAATLAALDRATLVSLVPTMLARLLDAGLSDPPLLRHAMLGGGPTAPALIARAEAVGVRVAYSYGLTEACSAVTLYGKPLPGVTIDLTDDAEIVVGGPTVAPSRAPRFATGDLGAWDAHGRLHIIGRRADTIVTGGENVAPAEVEAVLLAYPAVADAAVTGRKDDEWGERVVALLVVRPQHRRPSDAELRAYCREQLAAFKVPKQFVWVNELPRNPTGKLLRDKL